MSGSAESARAVWQHAQWVCQISRFQPENADWNWIWLSFGGISISMSGRIKSQNLCGPISKPSGATFGHRGWEESLLPEYPLSIARINFFSRATITTPLKIKLQNHKHFLHMPVEFWKLAPSCCNILKNSSLFHQNQKICGISTKIRKNSPKYYPLWD